MDVQQLRYFVSVAENLSFTKASKELFITQPALSQQIAELERRLDIKLFIRSRHAVQLTAAGEALLPEAKILIAKSDNVLEIARQAKSGKAGCLQIGFLGVYERNFLPSLLTNFRHKYPHIKVSLKLLSLGDLDRALESRAVDVGFTLLEKPPPGLQWRTIQQDTLCIVSCRDHPLTTEKTVNFAQIANESFIFHDRHTSPRGFANLYYVCSNRGIIPSVNMAPNWGTVLMSIESGMGISILPRHIPEAYGSPYLHLSDFKGDDRFVDIAIAWNKVNSNPAISLFIKELESIKKLQPTRSS